MIKNPLDSKTLYFNLAMAICAFWVPQVTDFFNDHPDAQTIAFLVGNVLIRFITKEAVSFKMPIHFFGLVHSRTTINAAAAALARDNMELPK